jgi:hypothetical protein
MATPAMLERVADQHAEHDRHGERTDPSGCKPGDRPELDREGGKNSDELQAGKQIDRAMPPIGVLRRVPNQEAPTATAVA